MESLTVTIGRNDGQFPMDESSWEEFKATVRDSVRDTGAIVTDAEYEGSWDGVKEDAHVFVALAYEYKFDPNAMARLKGHLASAADTYRQDAIALAVGNSELITSDRAKALR